MIRTGATSVGFDPADRPRVYPDSRWQVIEQSADVTINTVPLPHGEEGHVPASYLILRPRPQGAVN